MVRRRGLIGEEGQTKKGDRVRKRGGGGRVGEQEMVEERRGRVGEEQMLMRRG